MKSLSITCLLVLSSIVHASEYEKSGNPLNQSLLVGTQQELQIDKIETLRIAVQQAQKYKELTASQASMSHSEADSVTIQVVEHRDAIHNAIVDLYQGKKGLEEIKANIARKNDAFESRASSIICKDRTRLFLSCFCCCTYWRSSWYPGKSLFAELDSPINLGMLEYKAKTHKDFPTLQPGQDIPGLSTPVVAQPVTDDSRR